LARLGAHSRVDVARWYLLRYVVSPPPSLRPSPKAWASA
jgi:hypothetical protein